MRPVKPRRRVLPKRFLLNDEIDERISPELPLYELGVPSCSQNKIHVNRRIIVIGCSNTAMAFFEELIFK